MKIPDHIRKLAEAYLDYPSDTQQQLAVERQIEMALVRACLVERINSTKVLEQLARERADAALAEPTPGVIKLRTCGTTLTLDSLPPDVQIIIEHEDDEITIDALLGAIECTIEDHTEDRTVTEDYDGPRFTTTLRARRR